MKSNCSSLWLKWKTFHPEPTVVDIVIKFFYCSVQSCRHKSMSHNDK